MTYKMRRVVTRIVTACVALVAQLHVAFAHTVTIGYESAGAGAVAFWYGSYHAGTAFTEGSLQLVGPSVNTTVAFTLLSNVKPGGLADGSTNFYSNGTTLVGTFAQSAYTGSGDAVTWQGVTISGLTPGSYTFTYIPIAVPTQEWEPIDGVILSGMLVLTAAQLGIKYAPYAVNGNQGAAGAGIDQAIANGATHASFLELANLTPEQLANALTQLSGEASTGSVAASMQMMNPFLTLLVDPFVEARGGTDGGFGPATAYAAERKPDAKAAAAYAAMLPKDKANLPEPKRWTVWGSAFGGYARTDGAPGSTGTHDTSVRAGGFASGFDYRATRDTVLGFGVAGGTANWGVADGLGGGKSDVLQAGVYGSTRFGAVYASLSAAYAMHSMTTDRTVSVAGTDQLVADFTAHSFGARFETGRRFDTMPVAITPYAALQAQSFRLPGYSETAQTGSSAFALAYDAQTENSARSELGAWLDRRQMLDGGRMLTLRARAAWAHDWNGDRSASAVFQTLPGSNFIVDGAEPVSDLLLASAGAEVQLNENVSLSAKFDGEFSDRSESYSGTGAFRYAW